MCLLAAYLPEDFSWLDYSPVTHLTDIPSTNLKMSHVTGFSSQGSAFDFCLFKLKLDELPYQCNQTLLHTMLTNHVST